MTTPAPVCSNGVPTPCNCTYHAPPAPRRCGTCDHDYVFHVWREGECFFGHASGPVRCECKEWTEKPERPSCGSPDHNASACSKCTDAPATPAPPQRCSATYDRQNGFKPMECELPAGHDGSHRKVGGGYRWSEPEPAPRAPSERMSDEPCPWCHGRRGDFRCGNQGFGEEDIDINCCPETTWREKRLVAHCHERCERVKAEAELEACRANNRNATRLLNEKDAEIDRLNLAVADLKIELRLMTDDRDRAIAAKEAEIAVWKKKVNGLIQEHDRDCALINRYAEKYETEKARAEIEKKGEEELERIRSYIEDIEGERDALKSLLALTSAPQTQIEARQQAEIERLRGALEKVGHLFELSVMCGEYLQMGHKTETCLYCMAREVLEKETK